MGSGDSSEAARRSRDPTVVRTEEGTCRTRRWGSEAPQRSVAQMRSRTRSGPKLWRRGASSLVQWAGRPAVCSRLAGFQLGRAVAAGQPARLPDLQGKALTVDDTGSAGGRGMCLLAGQLATRLTGTPGAGWACSSPPLLPAPAPALPGPSWLPAHVPTSRGPPGCVSSVPFAFPLGADSKFLSLVGQDLALREQLRCWDIPTTWAAICRDT